MHRWEINEHLYNYSLAKCLENLVGLFKGSRLMKHKTAVVIV